MYMRSALAIHGKSTVFWSNARRIQGFPSIVPVDGILPNLLTMELHTTNISTGRSRMGHFFHSIILIVHRDLFSSAHSSFTRVQRHVPSNSITHQRTSCSRGSKGIYCSHLWTEIISAWYQGRSKGDRWHRQRCVTRVVVGTGSTRYTSVYRMIQPITCT